MGIKLLLIILLIPITVAAEVKYFEQDEQFSNGVKYNVRITSERNNGNRWGVSSGDIYITCFANKTLQVLFYTQNYIDNDDENIRLSTMRLSVTHKFDTEDTSETSFWKMDLFKNDKAWYRGDIRKFIQNVAKANELNLRLNKGNDVLSFKLKGTAKPIATIISKCPTETPID